VRSQPGTVVPLRPGGQEAIALYDGSREVFPPKRSLDPAEGDWLTGRSVLAVLDQDEALWRPVVIRAIAAAEPTRGRLTLLGPVCPAPHWFYWILAGAPVSCDYVTRESLSEMEVVINRATALVPPDLQVVTRIALGRPPNVVRRALEAERYDVLVIDSRLARTPRTLVRFASRVAVEILEVEPNAAAAEGEKTAQVSRKRRAVARTTPTLRECKSDKLESGTTGLEGTQTPGGRGDQVRLTGDA
jgi:hypothetical protein